VVQPKKRYSHSPSDTTIKKQFFGNISNKDLMKLECPLGDDDNHEELESQYEEDSHLDVSRGNDDDDNHEELESQYEEDSHLDVSRGNDDDDDNHEELESQYEEDSHLDVSRGNDDDDDNHEELESQYEEDSHLDVSRGNDDDDDNHEELESQYEEDSHLDVSRGNDDDDDNHEELESQYEEKSHLDVSQDNDDKKQPIKAPNLTNKYSHGEPENVIPRINGDSNCDSLDIVIHEVVHLENNSQYLTDAMLINWGSISHKTNKFVRLIVLLTIALDLPATKGMKQGEYFDKFFDYPDYFVSRTLKYASTLMFLYCGVNDLHELECRSDLLKIGNENDHVVSCFASLRSDFGDKHAVDVFKECNRLVDSTPNLKKVTGTLIATVSKRINQNTSHDTVISDGATDGYNNAELADVTESISEKEEVVHSESGEQTDSLKSENTAQTILSSLENKYAHFKDIVSGKDKYTPQELNAISECDVYFEIIIKTLTGKG